MATRKHNHCRQIHTGGDIMRIMRAVNANTNSRRLRVMIAIQSETGLRLTEIAHLRHTDVSDEKKRSLGDLG